MAHGAVRRFAILSLVAAVGVLLWFTRSGRSPPPLGSSAPQSVPPSTSASEASVRVPSASHEPEMAVQTMAEPAAIHRPPTTMAPASPSTLASIQTTGRPARSAVASAARASRPYGRPQTMVEAPPGATAAIRTSQGNQTLLPDALGEFPRVGVKPGEAVDVMVRYEGAPGDPPHVILQAEDGGTFTNGSPVLVAAVDSADAIRFRFRCSPQAGTHRITLRRGTDVKGMDFWVEGGTARSERMGGPP